MRKADLLDFAKFDTPESLKSGIFEALGDLDRIEVLYSEVLVAIYVQPEKTAGGIILTSKTITEDRYQGVAALVVKRGPTAFKYDGSYDYEGKVPEVGDWVVLRPSDAWSIDVNCVPCRMVDSSLIRATVADPRMVY